ncbi:hypothetical protein NUSPORA_01549 [Nucleospora cyclopteri]
MDLKEDFTPDFTFNNVFGLFYTKNSVLKLIKGYLYTNINNKLLKINPASLEAENYYGTLSILISSFDITEKYTVIGYQNGKVEIITGENSRINSFHRKRVTDVKIINNFLYTGSSDGTVAIFDLELEEEQFLTCNSAVIKIDKTNNLTVVGCGDKTIKFFKDGKLNFITPLEDFIINFSIQGSECFVLCKSGASFFIDLDSHEKTIKTFQTFKKARNLIRTDHKLVIHTKTKIISYEITKQDTFGLKYDKTIEIPDKYRKIAVKNEEFFALSDENQIAKFNEQKIYKTHFEFHQTDILQVEIEKDEIFTASKEKLIVWSRESDFIALSFKIDLQGISCFCLFKEFLLIGTNEGIFSYKLKTFEFVQNINLGKIRKIAFFNDILAVCRENDIAFYDDQFSLIKTFCPPDVITCCKFSNNGLFCVSCLDTKLYVYNFPEMSQKFCLYGHSLPIRSFDFSPNNNLILTAGADKLVKLWGMDFGECRKTFIGDSKNTQFLTDDLFLFVNEKIIFNRKFDKLKSFPAFSSGFLRLSHDFFVYTEGPGISLYTMNSEEFMEEEINEQSEKDLIKGCKIVDCRGYNKFLQFLEKLEDCQHREHTAIEFYNFLTSTDLNELSNYLSILDFSAIENIFYVLQLSESNRKINKNTILNVKILKTLLLCHAETVKTLPNYEKLVESNLKEMVKMKERIGENRARLTMDIEGFYYE